MGQPVMQFQILAKNPDKVAEYYKSLFGWNIETNNALAYRVIQTGSEAGIQGGIWPSPPEGHGMVQLFVEVEDVQAAVEQSAQLGGNVIIQPQTLPDGDEMAVILDPEGISFGLFKPKAQ